MSSRHPSVRRSSTLQDRLEKPAGKDPQAIPARRSEPAPAGSDIDVRLKRAGRLGHGLRHVVAAVQPRLTLGPAGDQYEQEADQVARQVVSRLNEPAAGVETESGLSPDSADVQRETMPELDEEEDLVQPKLQMGMEGGAIDSEVESRIESSRGGGQSLGEEVRAPMESAFGADFGGVKVHTDSSSHQLNQSLQARAFTTGQDIFFRGGEYSPQSSGGQELLAHELTHVVQQNGPGVAQPRREDEP